jgi:hypothetical protein
LVVARQGDRTAVFCEITNLQPNLKPEKSIILKGSIEIKEIL